MFELLQSKSGHDIIKFQGKYLCSRVNPIRESSQWLKSIEYRILQNNPLAGIFVLGLGCGYKLKALQERFRDLDIIVIEPELEIYRAVAVENQELFSGSTILNFCHPAELIKKEKVRSLLKKRYVVLEEGLSVNLNSELLRIKNFLNGRNQEGARFLAQLHSEQDSLLQVDEAEKEELTSIKHLKFEDHPFDLAQHILQELIR